MRVRKGDTLYCDRFGEVIVVGFTENGWPCSLHRGRLFLVLCDQLVKDVQQESVTDVTNRYGVSRRTVWLWRRCLGIGRTNPGTKKMRAKLAKRVFTPERRLKSAKAVKTRRVRKLRSAQADARWAAGGIGKLATWTAKELALLGKQPDKVIAERTGRTEVAVR